MEKNARCTSLTDPPYSYMLNNSIYVVWLLIAVLCACIWPSRLLSSTLPSSLSMVPRYRTFTPRWWSAEVRLAPSIGTAVWSRQSINYNGNHTHIILHFMHTIHLNIITPHTTDHCWDLMRQEKSSCLPQQAPLPLNLLETLSRESSTCRKDTQFIFNLTTYTYIYSILLCVFVCEHEGVQYLESKHQDWSGCQSRSHSLSRRLYKLSGSHFFYLFLQKSNMKVLSANMKIIRFLCPHTSVNIWYLHFHFVALSSVIQAYDKNSLVCADYCVCSSFFWPSVDFSINSLKSNITSAMLFLSMTPLYVIFTLFTV